MKKTADGARSALNDELCSVCGRPPHVCDDPECVPVRDLAYVNCPICGETAGTNESAINKKLVQTRRVLSRLLYAFDNDTATAEQLRKVYAEEIAEAVELLHNACGKPPREAASETPPPAARSA